MPNKINNLGLNAEHISANLQQYEAARTGFFTLLLPEELNQKILEKVASTFNRLTELPVNPTDAIRLNVVRTTVPGYSLEPLVYSRGNEKIKFAGVPTWKDGSITVDDVIGMDTKAVLLAWKELAYDTKSRKGGRMADYKYDTTLVEYTQDYEIVRTWILKGSWCSDVDDADFDKENDGKRQAGATIQYDRAEMSEADRTV